MTDWDYELIGDVFRTEFDVYFSEQEKLANAGGGKTRQLFKGEYVKKFMVTKRINMVDDPSNGNLKSVFVLKPGEKKLIDERAKGSLAPRFEYKTKIKEDGTETQPEGFMKFEPLPGNQTDVQRDSKTLQVTGNDISYFEEEKEVDAEPIVVEAKAEVFTCPKCEKGFDSAKKLNGHKMSCKA